MLTKPVRDGDDFQAKLQAAGYQVQRDEQGKGIFIHEASGATFKTTEIQPNGKAIGPQLTATIERTAQQALSKSKGQSKGGQISMG
jgi:hypothetical protein